MAEPITTFGITAAGFTQVIAQTWCRKIRVRENYSFASPATTEILFKSSLAASGIGVCPQGEAIVFQPQNGAVWIPPGCPVGAVEAGAGAIILLQMEEVY
jgi:hypothetical protein